MRKDQQLAVAAALLHGVGLARRKVEEHATQNLVFLEDLVRIETLLQAQRAQLHCLRDHRHVAGDFVDRISDVIGNAVEENRNVIEQLVGRENSVGLERNACSNAFQPTLGQRPALVANLLRQL